MRFVVGIQTQGGQLILTKDLLDELCAALPDQEAALRDAFLALENKVKAATAHLGPEYA
jgi:hypothetical protein